MSSTVTPGESTAAPSFDQRASMVVRASSLFGIMPAMVVAVVLAILVSPLVGLLGLVVVAAGWAISVHMRARSSCDRLLASIGATRIERGTEPRWENVVDGLGVTSGVDGVELWRLASPHANGLAAGGDGRSVLVVTDGLIERLPIVELEGVAANLLCRIKDGSARYGTVTFGLLGGFLGTVDAASRLVGDGLGEQRSVQSDLAAVSITRYPPGLAAALERIEQLGSVVDGIAPATAHLWLAPVVADGAGVDPAIAATALQPLAYRAAVLHEL